jgi:hypothetical protein
MAEPTNEWLSRSLRVPGVLAVALGHPDETVAVKNSSPDFAAPAVEHALRCAADAFAVLRFQQLPAAWLRWEFEKASFYCTCGRDQSCFGIFSSKGLQQAAATEIERLLTEFSRSAEGK